MNFLDVQRLHDLEQRFAALEARLDTTPNTAAARNCDTSPIPDLVTPIKNNPELVDGAVTFGGSVTLGTHTYDYQWTRPTHWVADHEWEKQIDRLAALAHPVRGEILRHLLCGPASAAELVDNCIVSSTGTAYHHLHALHAAGWLTKASGSYSISPARVVPLMAIITACEAH